ncbi:hypothetical protein ILYODFUR_016980 [Ilyodon furcidens]|uniref:Uncharacterized protein n=1 Tax=Ilyodon furcidens TaxID=33524 RepID=A0ABV0UIM3_9TELE
MAGSLKAPHFPLLYATCSPRTLKSRSSDAPCFLPYISISHTLGPNPQILFIPLASSSAATSKPAFISFLIILIILLLLTTPLLPLQSISPVKNLRITISNHLIIYFNKPFKLFPVS